MGTQEQGTPSRECECGNADQWHTGPHDRPVREFRVELRWKAGEGPYDEDLERVLGVNYPVKAVSVEAAEMTALDMAGDEHDAAAIPEVVETIELIRDGSEANGGRGEILDQVTHREWNAPMNVKKPYLFDCFCAYEPTGAMCPRHGVVR